MTPLDPHLPVIVGLGEHVRRPGDDGPTEPAQLMATATRRALDDSGAGDALLQRVGLIAAVPTASWGDGNPGGRVAELLGIDAPTIRTSNQGGNGPGVLIATIGERIQAGTLDAGLLCGAEALRTLSEAMKRGEDPGWPAADPTRPADEVLEPDRPANTEEETSVGLLAPIMAYPLIEQAIRHEAGRTPDEHQEVISRLWSRFSEVAATNAASWSQASYSAAEIGTPSPRNRRVTLPYTKLLNSNIQVDQAAAVLVCSVAVAQELGVPREQWVFLHAGAFATDEWFLSERRELHRSPAIRACGEAAFAHAGVRADDLGPVDLYSCFPSAVELAARELDLPIDDPGRPLTCTGGLTFFGGPGNNYATHGIVAVARQLREAPAGTTGLSTALGWYATKHALGVYGNEPPAQPYAAFAAEPDRPAPRVVAEPGEYAGVAETCTLIFDRSGEPSYGILFALLDDGRRAIGHTTDPEVMAKMVASDILGETVELRADRSFTPACLAEASR
ncbi:MAG: acetyl-CoA acetyltransferase [Solirubrobacteraceae bacterium]|nr:acetyl-CoA acetyltransferase [Solirubrobacteraceae bacterium]